MKRGLAIVLGLFLINLVSAKIGYGYGGFSVTNFLSSPDAILLSLFFIIAAAVAIVLRKNSIFHNNRGEPNRGIIAVISFSVALLAVYGIYNSGFDLEGLFYGIGLSSDIFYPVMWTLFVAAAVFIIWKFGAGSFFIVSGAAVILIALFTDLIYEKFAGIIIGAVLILIGLFIGRLRLNQEIQTY